MELPATDGQIRRLTTLFQLLRLLVLSVEWDENVMMKGYKQDQGYTAAATPNAQVIF
jgi:hypothetical protein